jgi:hypothetical protein
VKIFTIRKVNHSQHPEKWHIKGTIIASKCENKIFATQPDKLYYSIVGDRLSSSCTADTKNHLYLDFKGYPNFKQENNDDFIKISRT